MLSLYAYSLYNVDARAVMFFHRPRNDELLALLTFIRALEA